MNLKLSHIYFVLLILVMTLSPSAQAESPDWYSDAMNQCKDINSEMITLMADMPAISFTPAMRDFIHTYPHTRLLEEVKDLIDDYFDQINSTSLSPGELSEICAMIDAYLMIYCAFADGVVYGDLPLDDVSRKKAMFVNLAVDSFFVSGENSLEMRLDPSFIPYQFNRVLRQLFETPLPLNRNAQEPSMNEAFNSWIDQYVFNKPSTDFYKSSLEISTEDIDLWIKTVAFWRDLMEGWTRLHLKLKLIVRNGNGQHSSIYIKYLDLANEWMKDKDLITRNILLGVSLTTIAVHADKEKLDTYKIALLPVLKYSSLISDPYMLEEITLAFN